MSQLEILQDQFKDAAKQFRKITHLVVYRKNAGGDCGGLTVTEVMRLRLLRQKSRTSVILTRKRRLEFERSLARRMRELEDEISDCQVKIEPNYNPTPERTLAYWESDADSSYDGNFYEQHWVLTAAGIQEQDMEWALETLETLARDSVLYIIDDKNLSGVADIYTKAMPTTISESYIRCWLMMVRYLQPSAYPKKVAEGAGFTLAKPGKKGYSVIENVFLTSARACSYMIDAITPVATNSGGDSKRKQPTRKLGKAAEKKRKKKADKKNKEPLSNSANAVLDLLKQLKPNHALTGPEILKELDKQNIFIDLSTLTSRIMHILKKSYGVKNTPRIGYYIPRT